MHLFLGEYSFELNRLSERSVLRERKTALATPLLEFGQGDIDRHGTDLILVYRSTPFEPWLQIAVTPAQRGTHPGCCVLPGNDVVLAVDSQIHLVDLDTRMVLSTWRLSGLFYQFVTAETLPVTLIVHELGVAAIKAREIVWQFEHDILESHALEGQVLILTFADGKQVRLDVQTGREMGS